MKQYLYGHFNKQFYETHYKRYDPRHKHLKQNKQHYQFLALSIALALLSALALTLSQN